MNVGDRGTDKVAEANHPNKCEKKFFFNLEFELEFLCLLSSFHVDEKLNYFPLTAE